MSRRSHHRRDRGPRPARPDAVRGPARPPAPASGASDPSARLVHDPEILAAPVQATVASEAAVGVAVSSAAPSVDPSAGSVPDLEPAAAEDRADPGRQPVEGATAAEPGHPSAAGAPGCTAPQLRRFIKSRTWVPMHELRRRFGINGAEDDVTPVSVDGTTIFVGLPRREGQLLGELLRAGDIGYELSLDPHSPVVIGVYPMRPVPRH